MRIDVLNGVNLDLLGRRDPAQYGDGSLQDLETQVYAWARELGLQVRCRQTNHEGEYVEFLHAALDNADALVDEAMTRWRECVSANHWPGYPADVHQVGPVPWERDSWAGVDVDESVPF